MKNIQEMKNTLKELSAEIRQTRKEHKLSQKMNGYGSEGKLSDLIFIYRHLHIAYGLIRGKRYNEIENKTKEGNEPKWNYINKIIETLEKESK